MIRRNLVSLAPRPAQLRLSTPPAPGEPTKICHHCHQHKPLREFHRNRTRPDGLQLNCKVCCNEAAKQWARDNPQRYRAIIRRYDQRHPEKAKARNKAAYQRFRQDPARVEARRAYLRRYWHSRGKYRIKLAPMPAELCSPTNAG